jgi:hypothetical protein
MLHEKGFQEKSCSTFKTGMMLLRWSDTLLTFDGDLKKRKVPGTKKAPESAFSIRILTGSTFQNI